MKKFLLENKLVLSILIMFVSFSIIYGSIQAYKYFTKEKPKTVTELSDDNISLSSIDKTKQPIMYDFLNGSMGKYSNFDGHISPSYYIMCINKKYMNKAKGYAYITKNGYGEFYPPTSTGNVKVNFDEGEWKIIKGFVNTWPDKYCYKEKNYIFCVIPVEATNDISKEYCAEISNNSAKWSVVDLNLKYPESEHEKNTNGLDIQWIRKPEYKPFFDEKYNTDMNDEFFDRFSIGETHKLKSDQPGKMDIEMVVLGKDSFDVKIGVFDEDTTFEFLKESGYDIKNLPFKGNHKRK